MASKTCTIESADYIDGRWVVRVFVQSGVNSYSSTHDLDGAESLSEDEMIRAVLALY